MAVRYVAIGDSFTEGVGDERADGTPRGWADRLAARLAVRLAARGERLEYANLAIRGRLLEPIVADQLTAALALDPAPTVVTLNGGGNDMMRPGVDLDRLRALTAEAVTRCRAAGVRVVVLSGADPSGVMPGGRVIHRRASLLTELLRALSRDEQVPFADVFGDGEIRRRVYWSPDRLHLNPDGHRRVADLLLPTLDTEGGPLTDPAHASDRADVVPGAVDNARYYADHVLPWVGRRVRGRSTGDSRTAKYDDWHPVDGAAGDDPLAVPAS